MAITRIGNPAIADQRGINFRNIIINGGMDIAQRGTSVTSHSSDSYTTVDRWKTRVNGLGVWTVSQSTDVPTAQGFSNSLKWDCTTADASPAASNYVIHEQKFEGQNLQYLKYGTSSAQSLTLSFWVKCNKATTASLQLQDHNNSKMVTKSYTINSANTWEKKIITFNGNTSDTFTNDANLSLGVRWWLDSGSDYTSGTPSGDWEANDNTKRNNNNLGLASSTSNEWYITGVQLEAGQVASDFEFVPYDITFERCQRYFQQWVMGTSNEIKIPGFCRNTTTGNYPLQFKSIMRSAPTASSEFSSGKIRHAYSNDTDCTSFTANSTSVSDAMLTYGASSPALTTGQGSALRFFSGGNIKMDAEL